MRRLLLLALALPLAASLGGCALIWEGTTQDVQVSTTPVDGARCDVSNGYGSWNVVSTPGSVQVRKSDTELKVDCTTPDGRSGGTVVPAEVNGTVYANIALGGPVGMAVDFATGAAWTYPAAGPIALAPPRQPVVTVTPMASAATPAAPTPYYQPPGTAGAVKTTTTTASLNAASMRAATANTAPALARTTTTTTTMASAPFAPTSVLPPENPLPMQPVTASDAWNTGQVQYFKLAQQSIEDLHNKRLLTDKEYLEKMRLLSERYGPQ